MINNVMYFMNNTGTISRKYLTFKCCVLSELNVLLFSAKQSVLLLS